MLRQMGSHMKKAIFEEQIAKALKNWHKEAKVRNRQLKKAGLGGDSSSPSSPPPTTGHATSPLPLLDEHQAGNGESLPISPMTDHPLSSPPNKDRSPLESADTDGRAGETHPPSKRQMRSRTALSFPFRRAPTIRPSSFSIPHVQSEKGYSVSTRHSAILLIHHDP